MNITDISDHHRKHSPHTREIQFFNKKKELLFCIPDDNFIQLFYGNGDYTYALCHWLDHKHTEINGQKFHNDEFAECMEKNGISYLPVSMHENTIEK